MVPAVRPLVVAENVPEPEPLAALVSAVVGVVLVLLYTTPRSVTGSPPSAVTLPPSTALVPVTLVAAAVVTVGEAVPVMRMLSNAISACTRACCTSRKSRLPTAAAAGRSNVMSWSAGLSWVPAAGVSRSRSASWRAGAVPFTP